MKNNLTSYLMIVMIIMGFVLATPLEGSANWWDKFGEPQYGGKLTLRTQSLSTVSFDPSVIKGPEVFQYEFEPLFVRDWTLDPDVWSVDSGFIPMKCYQGLIADGWEQQDPLTVKIHLREDACWQNKPPVNGRKLTSEDVQYTFDRLLGTGSGFKEPNPFFAGQIPNIERVVATDAHAVLVKFKNAGALNIFNIVQRIKFVAREWVEQGDLQNWEKVIGTGPWMVTDYLRGTSLTFSKNPGYYGYDERHPRNQLPYFDTLKILEIPDNATALAALRTNKIDLLDELAWAEVQTLPQTRPDIKLRSSAPYPVNAIDLRCDTKPFTDIKVRIAMQMAIDTRTIAKSVFHIGGDDAGTPCGLISPLIAGWSYPYEQWSTELKNEYNYNPDKARQLLADAGYPNGFSTNCAVSTRYSAELFQVLKSYYTDIGVDVDFQIMDPAAFEQFVRTHKHDQMALANWAGGGPPNVYPARHSKGQQNATFNNDKHYDELYDQLFKSKTIEEAQQISVAIDKYTLEQHWAVVISGNSSFQAWQPWIAGMEGSGRRVDYIYARLWMNKPSVK